MTESYNVKARALALEVNRSGVFSGADIIATALQEAAETARNDALEEAATVACENVAFGPKTTARTAALLAAGFIADAIRALKSKAGPPEEKWQPIETAPKETMESILVVSPEGCQLAFWSEGSNDWLTQETGGYLWDSPTHWMPLPTPPKAGE